MRRKGDGTMTNTEIVTEVTRMLDHADANGQKVAAYFRALLIEGDSADKVATWHYNGGHVIQIIIDPAPTISPNRST